MSHVECCFGGNVGVVFVCIISFRAVSLAGTSSVQNVGLDVLASFVWDLVTVWPAW
jgi:hypothetical protein